MKCPKCNSENVKVAFVQEQQLKERKKGWLYRLVIGWWWEPLMWVGFFGIKLIVTIFKPKKYKMKTKTRKMAVCQNCGKSWKA